MKTTTPSPNASDIIREGDKYSLDDGKTWETVKAPDTRPLAERITQGLVARERYTGHDDSWRVAAGFHRVCGGANTVSGPDSELIAEAFNVTYETGRTPRQLADERAELIAALRALLFDSPNDGGMTTSDNIADAHELLTRLTP